MPDKKIKLGIVGVGKIVRDQHLPSIAKNGGYDLIATASRNASVDGVAAYKNIESMLNAVPDLEAVALCMPPQYRYNAAHLALEKGLHVLLEKPPGATVSEVEQLASLAQTQGVSLYATWHSRYGTAVETARTFLAERELKSVTLNWKEDVRKWHPGQEWIWQAGGLGVFDPGINGLSILTYVMQEPPFVTKATLSFPENKAAPIAASIDFSTPSGLSISSEYDWRQAGHEVWNIEFETDQGSVKIIDGGGGLLIDGEPAQIPVHSEHGEYETIYARFAEIIAARQSDVDLVPLKLVADAFLLGKRETLEAFQD